MIRFDRRVTTAVVVLAVMLSSLLVAAGQPKSKRVPKKEIPAKVSGAIQKAYPNATITSCSAEPRDAATVYVLRVKDGKTVRMLTYSEGGTFLESREQVGVNQVPVAVTGAYAARYPRGKLLAAEKLVKGQAVTYHLLIDQDKVRYDDLYEPSGMLLSTRP